MGVGVGVLAGRGVLVGVGGIAVGCGVWVGFGVGVNVGGGVNVGVGLNTVGDGIGDGPRVGLVATGLRVLVAGGVGLLKNDRGGGAVAVGERPGAAVAKVGASAGVSPGAGSSRI